MASARVLGRNRPFRWRLVAVVGVLASLMPSHPSDAGAVPAAAAAPAPAAAVPARPNVILYLSDDQTWHSMHPEVMPYLHSEPYGSWVTFDEFVYSTPSCCPSRATMMTGAYSYQVGVKGNSLARFEDAETLPVWLERSGYRTALIGKYLNDPQGKLLRYRPPGWSEWQAVAGVTTASRQTENDYYDYVLNDNGTLVEFGSAPEDYQVDVLTDRAVEFIESTPGDQPFYLQISPRNPHGPIEPAPRHADLPVPAVSLPVNFNEADVRDKPAWVRALGMVGEMGARRDFENEMRAMRSVDESLERIVEAVAARGQLDDTVIIYTTDNGYSRGSHRYVRKVCPYEECITGPLMVRFPGAAVSRVTDLVSNIDLAPTIGQLAGVTAAIPQDGTSLLPLLEGTATGWRSDALLNWRANWTLIPAYWGVRTHDWKYVEYSTGERELYDLVNDPYEMENLVRDPAYAVEGRDLRARLRELRYRADHRLPSWP